MLKSRIMFRWTERHNNRLPQERSVLASVVDYHTTPKWPFLHVNNLVTETQGKPFEYNKHIATLRMISNYYLRKKK